MEWQDGELDAGGVRIHYYRRGTGRPLVLAHGMSDNGKCWTRLATVLDDRYDIIGDADTFRRIALNWEIDCVEEPLARYRVHRGSLSWKKVEKFSVEIRQSIADYLREIPGFKEKYASELHKLEFDAAWSDAKIWVRNGKREEARRALKPFLGFKKAKALFLATFLPNVLYCALERTYLKRYGFS